MGGWTGGLYRRLAPLGREDAGRGREGAVRGPPVRGVRVGARPRSRLRGTQSLQLRGLWRRPRVEAATELCTVKAMVPGR